MSTLAGFYDGHTLPSSSLPFLLLSALSTSLCLVPPLTRQLSPLASLALRPPSPYSSLLFCSSVCSGKRRYNIKLWKTFTDCFNCLSDTPYTHCTAPTLPRCH